MNKEQCRQGEWNTVRWTNRSNENEWALIHSNQVMENSQITNVCNDGEDNDLESLRKGHLSLACKVHKMDTRRWESLESSHMNSHKQLTKTKGTFNGQYKYSMEKDIVYMRLFIIIFSFTCVHSEYQ